jgi:hypothetical protein
MSTVVEQQQQQQLVKSEIKEEQNGEKEEEEEEDEAEADEEDHNTVLVTQANVDDTGLYDDVMTDPSDDNIINNEFDLNSPPPAPQKSDKQVKLERNV